MKNNMNKRDVEINIREVYLLSYYIIIILFMKIDKLIDCWTI